MCAPRAHDPQNGATCLDLRNREAGPCEHPPQEPGTNPPLGPGSEGPTQAEDSSIMSFFKTLVSNFLSFSILFLRSIARKFGWF